ncbi:SpoIIE family protein phosphatase [Actinacidiphila paucisporea]|uniref:protein-serine/threonine phosphatase n=1 Tax=Actinacidiphila paucisporea TaxID=310782 RepID=A0A1M7QG98_9ACTN|nr:SpoIIE family protein phosphatase [Actinacidiphila paucisporea]SHN29961.1 Serine phosphatase RsbU, regulator of sigma subunit [Actinacidiphila paucisporea]
MSSSFELVAVISDAGTVVTWAPAAERLWGFSAAEALGLPADRLVTVGGEPGRPGPLNAARGWSGPVDIRQADGRGRNVDFRVTPFFVGEAGHDWLVWEAAPAGRLPPSGLDTAALETLFQHAPMGAALWGLDLRCTWYNEAITGMEFIPGGPRVGRRLTELLASGRGQSLEAAMRRILERGTASVDLLWMPPGPDGSPEPSLSLSLFRVDDADGRALGLCLIVEDIRESWSRQRLGLLVEAGTRIGTTLDVMVTAQELADTAVPTLADFVTVDLADSITPDQEPLERVSSNEAGHAAFYRGGMASIHSGVPEAIWPRGMPVFVPPSSPYTEVWATGTSHFEPVMDTSPGTWRDDDPSRAAVLQQFGMHSLMIIPLQARGNVLGIVTFFRSENPAPFSRADLFFAEGLAARASLSLDNARRYSRERTAALALQRDLLPHILRSGDAVEVASRYLPADKHGGVGGDWFDVIPMSHDRVALVVGDVVGHGINAAATMGRLRMVLNTLTNLELPPDQVLARLDELVVGLARDRPEEELTSPSVGATCIYVVYDPATRSCTMASAGHPPPAIVAPDGSVEFVALPSGAPIGIGLGDFRSAEMHVEEGSVIALYTDGLVETREADIDQGLDRLRTALARPAATLDDLCTTVIDTMLPEGGSADDTALLLARTLPLPR